MQQQLASKSPSLSSYLAELRDQEFGIVPSRPNKRPAFGGEDWLLRESINKRLADERRTKIAEHVKERDNRKKKHGKYLDDVHEMLTKISLNESHSYSDNGNLLPVFSFSVPRRVAYLRQMKESKGEQLSDKDNTVLRGISRAIELMIAAGVLVTVKGTFGYHTLYAWADSMKNYEMRKAMLMCGQDTILHDKMVQQLFPELYTEFIAAANKIVLIGKANGNSQYTIDKNDIAYFKKQLSVIKREKWLNWKSLPNELKTNMSPLDRFISFGSSSPELNPKNINPQDHLQACELINLYVERQKRLNDRYMELYLEYESLKRQPLIVAWQRVVSSHFMHEQKLWLDEVAKRQREIKAWKTANKLKLVEPLPTLTPIEAKIEELNTLIGGKYDRLTYMTDNYIKDENEKSDIYDKIDGWTRERDRLLAGGPLIKAADNEDILLGIDLSVTMANIIPITKAPATSTMRPAAEIIATAFAPPIFDEQKHRQLFKDAIELEKSRRYKDAIRLAQEAIAMQDRPSFRDLIKRCEAQLGKK